MESHLLQMRGLKLENEYKRNQYRRVASFTDAWIETLFEQVVQQLYRRIFYRCVD